MSARNYYLRLLGDLLLKGGNDLLREVVVSGDAETNHGLDDLIWFKDARAIVVPRDEQVFRELYMPPVVPVLSRVLSPALRDPVLCVLVDDVLHRRTPSKLSNLVFKLLEAVLAGLLELLLMQIFSLLSSERSSAVICLLGCIGHTHQFTDCLFIVSYAIALTSLLEVSIELFVVSIWTRLGLIASATHLELILVLLLDTYDAILEVIPLYLLFRSMLVKLLHRVMPNTT